MAGMWLVGEDLPQETNRVTLNPTCTDQFGLPVPNVHFDDHPNDVAMREHAYAAANRSTPLSTRYACTSPVPDDPQPRHRPDELTTREDGVVERVRSRPTTSRTSSCPTGA